ncbi:glycosyltransferase family 2 protein [Robiginitalea sp. M366]|uniref:glycosyltransferase family 2 protein n=1 Tax=Robiginitalea aestuariiviva TaxID=3036903 RepID=UPI00240D0AF0|nr:glycosyltransferase family 2 protein [Robiginitalea aestuariiviva]MDG1572732.1 glycosyltransferase family 2 protein [Robiginitalea aestuariiviva]
MSFLTVFTPTYNRAYCLGQCYNSLVRQTRKDFIWLIIDDGSTDNTRELVAGWIEEKKVNIRYHYQKNQGMHGAHNSAYALINTELNVCIDSDDFMPSDAVEKIALAWKEIQGQDHLAGIVALDANKDGEIIGTKMPAELKEAALNELYHEFKITGDKKLIYRTEVVKKYEPYPIFSGERFVPLGSLYLQIDQDYKLFILNEVVCIVEYLPDGSSLNIFKQYRRHPRGFIYSREVAIKYGWTLKQRFKNAVHYVASKLQIKDFSFFYKSPNLGLTYLALFPGILLFFYILAKTNGLK